jgi:hypothetical protein
LLVNTCKVDVAIDPGVRTTKDGVVVAPRLEKLAVIEILPENPRTLVTVIVAVPVLPGRMGIELGATTMVKLVKLKDTRTWWESRLLVPVIVMLYLPGGVNVVVEIVMMEVDDLPGVKVWLEGVKDTEGPLATLGEIAQDMVTVPGKPPRLVRVIVEVAEEPAGKDGGMTGPAEMLKSDTATTKVTVCVTLPLIPVTVKV